MQNVTNRNTLVPVLVERPGIDRQKREVSGQNSRVEISPTKELADFNIQLSCRLPRRSQLRYYLKTGNKI